MKSCLAVFAALLLSALSVAFIADDEPLKNLVSKLEKLRTGFPQEKVHLHLDKPYYAIGDSIWFKAYVVEAETHQLSGMSKVLNVELIDERDSIAQSLRLPVAAGLAWGDFQLSDTLKEGNYRIRAYTNYMRNFGDEYFFDQVVQVGDPISHNIVSRVDYAYQMPGSSSKVNATINYSDGQGAAVAGKEVLYDVQLGSRSIAKGRATTDAKGNIQIAFSGQEPLAQAGRINATLRTDEKHVYSKVFLIKPSSDAVDVQFFPEGGNQVLGIRSKVAFKALGSDGLGKEITGYVTNSSGEKVAEFRSEHAGMGFFMMQPVAGQTYTATVKFSDGSEKRIILPKAQPEGFVLAAGNLDSTSLLVKISASPAVLSAGQEVTLIAQSNSVVKFASKTKLENSVYSVNIPKSRFPTGILQLTLFNQQNQPLAERLVFINHNDNLNVTVNGPKTSAARKKVQVGLDVKDTGGKPVLGSFSVSVTNGAKVPVDVEKEPTIFSDILLTSDIKGYVEKPNYYFNAVDDQKIRHLDNLMLTQGWRRFSWKDILADNYPQIAFQMEKDISISGRVTQNNKPVPGGKVTLLSSQGSMFAIDTLTDAEGKFVFNNLSFPDDTRIVLQARTARGDKSVDIQLDRIPPQPVTGSKNAADYKLNISNEISDYLKSPEVLRRDGMLGKTIVLSEVNVKGRTFGRGEKVVEGSANLAGRADAVVTADQLENCINLADCLQGKVAGLVIQDDMPFLMRTMATSLSSRTPLAIILDGVRMSDSAALTQINPQDVQAIEVLRGATASVYGMLGGAGVLVITTKTGKARTGATYDAPGVLTYKPKAYYQAKEFYMPNYDNPKVDKNLPDLRSTIYWHPNVIVKDGKASIEFFNGATPGTYRITMEGVDANGKLARYVYNYPVNQ